MAESEPVAMIRATTFMNYIRCTQGRVHAYNVLMAAGGEPVKEDVDKIGNPDLLYNNLYPITVFRNEEKGKALIHAWRGMYLYVGDVIITTEACTDIEFIIGGRVGIETHSAIRIEGERQVKTLARLNSPSAIEKLYGYLSFISGDAAYQLKKARESDYIASPQNPLHTIKG